METVYLVFLKGIYGEPDELSFIFKTRDLAEDFIHRAGIKWPVLSYYIVEEFLITEENKPSWDI